MERAFHGGVATPALFAALQDNNGPWARSVLAQMWSMPDQIITAVLSGEAEWQIESRNTIIITLAESR